MLELTGHLGLWSGLALALVFAVATWLVYRRESRRSPRFGIVLPIFRVLVVCLIIFMLTGPSLRYRQHIGEPGRVIVFIDGSESMAMTDSHMEIARKLLIARSGGWLSKSIINTQLYDIAQQLRDARLRVEEAIAGPDRLDLKLLGKEFHTQITQTQKNIAEVNLAALPQENLSGNGTILREYWLDLPGESISDFTGHPRYHEPPTGSHTSNTFEAPANLGDNYASRFRGYIHPPIDGRYTFYLASDGPSELWLSASEDVTAKKRIITIATRTNRWQWTTGDPSVASVTLKGGQRYYIEALHKESTGDDHFAVGWQLPIGAMERPIPGKRLSPFAAAQGSTPQKQRDSMTQALRTELIDPLESFLSRSDIDDASSRKNMTDLAALASVARRWEMSLESLFEIKAKALAESGDATVAAALAKVDQLSRWERTSTLLLGEEGLVRRLESKHQIELYATHNRSATLLWSSQKQPTRPVTLDPPGWTPLTDLAAGISDHVAPSFAAADNTKNQGDTIEQRTAAILFTDGRHNTDASDPMSIATVLGQRRVPLYTVGLGSLTRPEDLAVRSIEGPDSVFHEDRIQGELVLDDDMPPGKPFIARIEVGKQIIWQKNLVTERSGLRRLPFDFAVKELLSKSTSRTTKDVKELSIPLQFTATITSIEGESEQGNNSAQMTVHAVTEPRRILIIDGRPRWEARYLRNLFSRDQRWQVNTLLAGVSEIADHWRRGEESGAFPRDLQTLYKYDVIIFGDLPTDMLMPDELGRLRDFVGERGGGMIFIDGQRGHLRRYAETPLGELLPIEWLTPIDGDNSPPPTRLKLTVVGQASTPLRLLPDEMESGALWQTLAPPHWLASVRELPGASVLAQAVIGDEPRPAIVERSYGAGKVIYMAFDESWRWRYEVADQYHARFWNQMARQIAEQPYAVQDQFVKLDAGSATYQPGDKAEIRARLRDRDGKPMLKAKAAAQIYRDGRKVATLPLDAGDSKSGSFAGQTGPLEPGKYEVGVSIEGIDDAQLKARAQFTVEAPVSIERRAVTMDESTLSAMASRAFGRYYREEDLPQLIERLEPTSSGRIIVTETALWRSYWWFVPIMLLLTMEWLLRKRAGLL